MACDKTTGIGCYPKGDWHPDFQKIDETPPTRVLFEEGDLPAVAPPGPDIDKGCVELKKLQDARTKAQEDDITRQGQRARLAAIQPVLKIFDLSYDGDIEARALVGEIGQNVDYQVFKAKAKFGRGRPRKMCDALEPMFEPPDGLHPAHGSYPSAHAATAHCWASLLGALFQDAAKAKKAVEAAEQVALNREIAGVHFCSDTEAGRALGEAIAKAILDAKRLTEVDIKILRQR